jgi:hypothetical protein
MMVIMCREFASQIALMPALLRLEVGWIQTRGGPICVNAEMNVLVRAPAQ